MTAADVEQLASLLRERNALDARIAAMIGRPMTSGHLGEWLASRIFDIELELSAAQPAIDGRFRDGPLRGRTVNVKWYLKREGLLDMSTSPALDHYLVLTGPTAQPAASRGGVRPWCIASVHLFDARTLLAEQRARGIAVGTASSVRDAQWRAAEIYPNATNPTLPVSPEQVAMLGLLAPA